MGMATESLDPGLRRIALATPGFMPAAEGDALFAAAVEAVRAVRGPIVEVGSYCGRSTVWLGAAARAGATVVLAVDHHRGSEENQAGWQHHDPAMVDSRTGLIDTLPRFRRTIHDAGLDSTVIAVVGDSPAVAAVWPGQAAMVFVDGGHGEAVARADYDAWAPRVALGGILAVHDVFPDPADGGQAPYEQIYLRALASGGFVEIGREGSLRVLRRVGAGPTGVRRT